MKTAQEHIDETYTPEFYAENLASRDAYRALARCIAPHIATRQDVVDLGCGAGLLVDALMELGIHAVGCDASVHALAAAPATVRQALWQQNLIDTCAPPPYDVAICIEVAEHIPERFADALVATVARSATRKVIWSAAPPGQGGTDHVNCQLPAYWLSRFSGYDFYADPRQSKMLRSHMREQNAQHHEYADNFYVLERK